ncbi:hypothetical protein D3C87_2013380 [compost metagenome]
MPMRSAVMPAGPTVVKSCLANAAPTFCTSIEASTAATPAQGAEPWPGSDSRFIVE